MPERQTPAKPAARQPSSSRSPRPRPTRTGHRPRRRTTTFQVKPRRAHRRPHRSTRFHHDGSSIRVRVPEHGGPLGAGRIHHRPLTRWKHRPSTKRAALRTACADRGEMVCHAAQKRLRHHRLPGSLPLDRARPALRCERPRQPRTQEAPRRADRCYGSCFLAPSREPARIPRGPRHESCDHGHVHPAAPRGPPASPAGAPSPPPARRVQHSSPPGASMLHRTLSLADTSREPRAR